MSTYAGHSQAGATSAYMLRRPALRTGTAELHAAPSRVTNRHIPDRFEHLLRYVGWYYSTRCRGERARKAVPAAAVQALDGTEVVAARAKSAWARLIHKVYEVDPLVCAKCGTSMQVIALIDDATVIRRILEHLGLWAPRKPRQNQRAPPAAAKGIDGSKPPAREWTYHPLCAAVHNSRIVIAPIQQICFSSLSKWGLDDL